LLIGSHTIAVVKAHKSYELLKNSFSDLFGTVNRIIKEGKITVCERDIPVEIFLGVTIRYLQLQQYYNPNTCRI
jgi:hypothetical protein